MKRTLIASAVAALTLSSTVFPMDSATDLAEMLESLPTIYGNIQLAHVSQETDITGQNITTHELIDNDSTLGFKHTSVINEDLEAFFKAEFEFDADNNATNSSLGETLDEAYIGVRGNIGSIQAGTDDTVYEWVDKIDILETVGIEGDIANAPEGDNLQYISPEIMEGLVLGVTFPFDSDTTFGGALAANYSFDNLDISVAYALGRKEGVDDGTGTGTMVFVDEGNTFGLSASLELDNLTLIAQYESRDESITSDVADKDDKIFWGLEGIYVMGANTFALAYSMETVDLTAGGDSETSSFSTQALHSVSDNVYIYLEYLRQSTETGVTADVDNDELAVGATYLF